ncbi:hypothetical protein [Halomonas ventosae]|uniref:Cell division protein FtsZ n=1 Tax=Halomonas ventosae TaxID=229007 RepID=A0A2T0VI12_9GAMM|nr:hypothetical protein [Halomonas ventosae]PRY69868.1 cell division protein FtsZ [Halomonas ventosae]
MRECNVIGVGGAGLSLARRAHELVGGQFMAINTDREPLEEMPTEQSLVIGPKTCGGKGATSPARGRQAAEESLGDIRARLPDSGKVVLLAGLGGGAGTGAMPTLAKEVIQRDLNLLVAVTLPFGLEAERREAARAGLKELEATGATIITHDHAEHRAGSMSLEAALGNSAEALAQRVQRWIKGESDAQ